MPYNSIVGVLVLQEVVLNQLEEVGGLLFASLNMFSLNLNVTLGVVVVGALDDETVTGSHQLSLIRDLLIGLRDNISFNHTILVDKVIHVNTFKLCASCNCMCYLHRS
ncbi:hypothetical protein ACFX1Q_043674 [Malus domestica]